MMRLLRPQDAHQVVQLLGSRPVEGWLTTWVAPQRSEWWVADIGGVIEALVIARVLYDSHGPCCIFVDQIEGRYKDGKLTRAAAGALSRFRKLLHEQADHLQVPVAGVVAESNDRHRDALSKRGYTTLGYIVERAPAVSVEQTEAASA